MLCGVLKLLSEYYYTSLCYRTTKRFDFFIRLWSVRTALILNTQNLEISEFSTRYAYKYETKCQTAIKNEAK